MSAEGVTLSGVLRDTKPCTDKPLESVVYDRRRCRGAGKSSPPVLISQAKGQGRCSNGNMHAGSVLSSGPVFILFRHVLAYGSF